MPFWSRDPAALMRELGSGSRGLASAEAAARLRARSSESIDDDPRREAARTFVRQFESPLVLILVVAAAISMLLRDWIEAAIVLAIVIGSALLGFGQEYRASRAVAQLRQRLALTARVVRDGVEQSVPASSIVPGDLVLLSAGNLVPADGVVVEAHDFLVSEASLTGESFPVEKRPGTLAADTPVARRTNSIFLGTSVRSGMARILAVETGRGTALAKLAARLADRPTETEFERGVREFGSLLMRVMVLMVLFVMAANHLLGRPAIESLLYAMALAVGLSPELLPAIVSVTLAHGARAMSRRGVLVRRLQAIENLGSIDVLCTDKTGTLTEGVIGLDAAVTPDGETSAEVLRLAVVNATFETGIDNPLDAAIVAAGRRAGVETGSFTKIDEIPYDFLRKRLTIVVAHRDDPDTHLVVTKGAFASVLDICSTLRVGGNDIPLDPDRRARLEEYFRTKGTAGFRVLALAARRLPARPHYGHDDEQAMSLAGLLLFVDPPKPRAPDTLAALGALGIRIKMVTGDNRFVAAHVAEAIGLDPGAMLTGERITALRDEALWHLAEQTHLFVEVDPQQKERIVRALQRTGHSVGYLGDGINDAPALHVADVGISVDQAADVARESADIVLLQPDLDVLRRGVEDGRRTFANTLKYICITTSANFGNMLSMALATPLLPFLPLAAKQILLNNFLSDLPSIAISTDRVDARRVERAQRWNLREVRAFMIVFGLVSTAFDLLTFGILLKVFGADEVTFQTAWFVVSLATELAVMLVLRTQGPALASAASPLLLWATVAVGLAAVAIPYSGALAKAFGFVPLPTTLMLAMLLVTASYVLATEVAKLAFFARRRGT